MRACTSCDKLDINTVHTRYAIKSKAGVIHWHIYESDITPDMNKDEVINSFRKGFKILEEHFAPLRFEATSDFRKAPIRIFFKQNGNVGLPEPFERGTLAYAFLPRGNPLGIQSDIYFNDSFNWTGMHTGRSKSLLKVFVHEALHALGLHHSDYREDIMFPSYMPNNTIKFTQDTIDGINKLYGDQKKRWAPVAPPVAPVPPTPEEPEIGPPLFRKPVNWIELIKIFLVSLFTTKRRLYWLTNSQLIRISQELGIQGSEKRTKRQNVVVIAEILEL